MNYGHERDTRPNIIQKDLTFSNERFNPLWLSDAMCIHWKSVLSLVQINDLLPKSVMVCSESDPYGGTCYDNNIDQM